MLMDLQDFDDFAERDSPLDVSPLRPDRAYVEKLYQREFGQKLREAIFLGTTHARRGQAVLDAWLLFGRDRVCLYVRQDPRFYEEPDNIAWVCTPEEVRLELDNALSFNGEHTAPFDTKKHDASELLRRVRELVVTQQ